MQADTFIPLHISWQTLIEGSILDGVAHLQGCTGSHDGMVWLQKGNAASAHIGIADGLDFLQAVLVDNLVEQGESAIQLLDQITGGHG